MIRYIIDTDPHSRCCFRPPASVEDYKTWMLEQYQDSQHKDQKDMVFSGISQQVECIRYAALDGGCEVFIVGMHASQAKEALTQLIPPDVAVNDEKPTMYYRIFGGGNEPEQKHRD